ncbi:MAG: acylphosphatase [Methanosarcinales archaeon]|nr:acylphosphatase [Methanosarcinales archaeon]
MKRAVIIAKGDVQRVGYRDTVEKIARKLKLAGFVENLKPYDVRIIAEGEDDVLNELITQIRIKDRPTSPVSVEELDFEFVAATGEFEYFEIRRGEWAEELGERLDTAGALLHLSVELGKESVELGKESVELGKKMLDKQDRMLDKQDVMIEKQDAHTQVLTEFRDQTQQSFGVLDVKYGAISENMSLVIEEMRKEREEREESMDRLTDAILELAESNRKNKR